MLPTDILSSEHRLIELVLQCLDRIAAEGLAQGRLDAAPARQALEFFRNFADRCHHGKEEKHLFPLMEQRGFARDAAPLACMLHEHALGREHLRRLEEAIPAAAAGDLQELTAFAREARAYVAQLAVHIFKEDLGLFPLANRTFTADEQARLLASFEHTVAYDMGTDAHKENLGIANDLAERYLVPRAEVAAAPACACGHHGHH